MARDINFTILTGVIATNPSWVPLANNKRALVFTLDNKESYRFADGRSASHTNMIVIEVLGKNAEKYFSEFTIHQRCQVAGYIRVDEMNGEDRVRIRAFRIEDMSGD